MTENKNEINHEKFFFDKIFVRKMNRDEVEIMGVATAKNNLGDNEYYQIYDVMSCTNKEYLEYIKKFGLNYENASFNPSTLKSKTFYMHEKFE